ncbi:MAG: DUF6049 family protein [Microbacteriaceae bacterium]|nr:DUF6049 family protein [Microbacteriaceae bacterium]
MRIVRPLLALAVVVGAFVAPAAMGPAAIAAVPTVESPAATAEISVDVVPAASGLLRAGEDLILSVVVANRSSDTLPAGTATVYLDRAVVDGRDSLATWLAEPDAALPLQADRGDAIAQVGSPELFPGESTALATIVVPAAAVGFDEAVPFGARRLSVLVASADNRPGEGRSTVTVNPDGGFTPTGLAIALPITLPASTSGVVSGELLETYTSQGGLLARQLDATFGRPVALGIDPRIIASIRLLGTSAPESATDWLARLESAPNQTFPLSYADTDIAATSQAGGGVLAPTSFAIDTDLFPEGTGAETAPPSPSPSGEPVTPSAPDLQSLLDWNYSATGIAWPRAGTVVGADLGTFAAAGLNTTILSSENSTLGDGATTGNAAGTIGEGSVLTSDAIISDLLSDAVDASTFASWEAAMVRLTASLAALAAEDPDAGAGRTVFATLGRSDALGGFRLFDTISALGAIGWSAPATLADARATTPALGKIVDMPVATEQVQGLQSMFASEAAVAQFATIAADPTVLTGDRRLSLLALASQSWNTTEPAWATEVGDYLATSGEVLSAVQVETATITQWSDSGPLPITISNNLPVPVAVIVTVTSRTAILDVTEPQVRVEIAANSQNRASIPVQSVANGTVVITISLTSETGVPLSQPAQAEITVQAGWETAVTSVLAGLLLLVFLLGIIRTVRRRRRPTPPGATEAAEQTEAAAAAETSQPAETDGPIEIVAPADTGAQEPNDVPSLDAPANGAPESDAATKAHD